MRRKIIHEDVCLLCSRKFETGVHALWDCAVAKDVWAGSCRRLQKSHHGKQDVLQLFLEMCNCLTIPEFELFIVQAWLIWNQRNAVVHGKKIVDPRWLNKRACDYLNEFQQFQDQLDIPIQSDAGVCTWKPPSDPVFKLNFMRLYSRT